MDTEIFTEPESPLQTTLLKRSRRRIIYSSDDEDTTYARPAEVMDIHLDCAPSTSSPNCRVQLEQAMQCPVSPVMEQADESIVIQLTHQSNEAWDSALDSSTDSSLDSSLVSASSTPAFKRGEPDDSSSKRAQKRKQQIIDLIIEEGLERHHLGKRRRRVQEPAVLILADSKLKEWPWNDKVCDLHLRPNQSVKQWTMEIRTGIIDIQARNVIIYFESLLGWNDVPPIKNSLESLCKAIRDQQPSVRIYISNILPRISGSPLSPSIANFNFILQQAIRSIGRKMIKIHTLTVYEHFVSKRGKVINPTHKYFQDPDTLTQLGCLLLRECFLREAGLKTYWFDGPRAHVKKRGNRDRK